jgi:uncharacterized membrane protein YphA (DoxX/SURF4 family)
MTNFHVDQSWLALRLTYGLVAFLAGLDKFFNLLTNWETYLSPVVTALLPLSSTAVMHSVGIVEMAVGVLILTRWTRAGAYVASVWLLCIAFNLLLAGSFFDIAVRDAALAVGAWTLGRLTEVRQPSVVRSGSDASAGRLHAEA